MFLLRCCALPQVLYERLVEAERLRAEAEKQRGDDLSKIARNAGVWHG